MERAGCLVEKRAGCVDKLLQAARSEAMAKRCLTGIAVCRTVDRLGGLEHTEHCAMSRHFSPVRCHTLKKRTLRKLAPRSRMPPSMLFVHFHPVSACFLLAVMANAAPSTPLMGQRMTAVPGSVSSGVLQVVSHCILFPEQLSRVNGDRIAKEQALASTEMCAANERMETSSAECKMFVLCLSDPLRRHFLHDVSLHSK